jgi:hypothetical protein
MASHKSGFLEIIRMNQRKQGSWWGLYTLLPLTLALLVVAAKVPMGHTLHQILLALIVVVVAILAWQWTERHATLMGADGVNAQAEEETFASAGFEPGRFAPSLTKTQAQYRSVMFTQQNEETPPRP